MSTVEVAGLRRTYPGPPPVAALRRRRPRRPGGPRRGRARSVGLRQDDAAAPHRRVRPSRRRHDHDRRDAASPAARHGCHRSGAASASCPRKARCSPTSTSPRNIGFGLHELARRGKATTSGRTARARRPLRLRAPAPARAVRRSATARRRRPRARAAAGRRAARRAVRRPRHRTAGDAARRRRRGASCGRARRPILVTHDQAEALTMADTVAVMREGTIVQASAPEDLYLRPVDMDDRAVHRRRRRAAGHAGG